MEHSLKIDLWEHQKYLVDRARHSFIVGEGWHYWDGGCGIGKTAAALELVRQMNYSYGVNFILVLTVKSAMKSVWEEDITTITEGFTVTVLGKGSSSKKAKKLKEVEDRVHAQAFSNLPADSPIEVVVVNYETARLLPLENHSFDMVIADESHRLSQHNSKISLELAKKLAKTPFKLAMTGTAWADHLKQIFGQFRFLAPIIYSHKGKHAGCQLFGHYNDFLERYCHVYTRDNIKIVTGYKNVPELMGKISAHYTQVRTEDVIDLPKLHKIERTFELPSYLRSAYKSMEKESVAHLENLDGTDGTAIAQYDITRRHRLHQLTRGWYVDFDTNKVEEISNGSSAAIRTVTGLLEEIGGEPTVIFTSYQKDVEMLEAAISKVQKVTPLLLTGRKDEHVAFQRGKGNVLLANLQAGSTGVRLHRAKYIIFYGLSVSTARTDFLQAIDRVHRHGQTNQVTMYTIVAKDTVDEEAYALLAKKAKEDEKAKTLL